MPDTTANSIDEYIAAFPQDVQYKLQEIRTAIRKVVPEAEEAIKYAIPTFVHKGKNLVHFAAFKNHIGFYPTPTGIESFKIELSKYKQGKGSVQFPLEAPMPLTLVTKIVKLNVLRIKEATAKKKK